MRPLLQPFSELYRFNHVVHGSWSSEFTLMNINVYAFNTRLVISQILFSKKQKVYLIIVVNYKRKLCISGY